MEESKGVKCIPFDNAEEFVEYLRPTGGAWGEEPESPWVFRGQRDADWKLVPSAWREEGKKVLEPIARRVERFEEKALVWVRKRIKTEPHQLAELRMAFQERGERFVFDLAVQNYAECVAVLEFSEMADSLGLGVVRDMGFIEKDVFEGVVNSQWPFLRPSKDWVLAQHHGVPTRLIDWSRKPLIAAFFAVDGFLEHNGDPVSIAVWAMNLRYLERIEPLYRQLQVLKYPRSQHSFYHAQDAVSTVLPQGERFYLGQGAWPSMEDYVREVYDGKDPEPIRKVTLSVAEVRRLVKILWQEGITRAHLMPTYDNVAAALKAKWRVFG
jgi:hypothetical protein